MSRKTHRYNIQLVNLVGAGGWGMLKLFPYSRILSFELFVRLLGSRLLCLELCYYGTRESNVKLVNVIA